MTDDKHASAKPHRRCRANELLEKVIAQGWCDEPTLARELVMSPAQWKACREDHEPMPLDRQLCLALLLIEKVPAMARQGHALRAQVAAAAKFNAGDTEKHAAPPTSRWG